MTLAGSCFRRCTCTVSLVVVAFISNGCDGTSEPTDDVLSVGGTYSTQVNITQNTCTGVTVQPLPTTVTHAAGSGTLSIRHGPLTYPGTISPTGSFTTSAVTVQGAQQGDQSALSITGQFSETGFIADVSVAVVLGGNPSCSYTVHWVGTKQGSRNTIP